MRQKIADYMNSMADLGVKGFRVDASKHMWPGDLQAIQVKTAIFFRYLSCNFTGFEFFLKASTDSMT